jgi:hypothetical protein
MDPLQTPIATSLITLLLLNSEKYLFSDVKAEKSLPLIDPGKTCHTP